MEFYRSDATDSPVAIEVQRLIMADCIVTTEPVIPELSFGVEKKAELKKLKETFDLYHLCRITAKIWADATDNAFELKRRDITVPAAALLICTAAISYGLKLLHADKHFKQMAKVLPLEESQP